MENKEFELAEKLYKQFYYKVYPQLPKTAHYTAKQLTLIALQTILNETCNKDIEEQIEYVKTKK